MSEKIDRVAAAILEAARTDLTQEECRVLARAAIDAMPAPVGDGVSLLSITDPNFDEDGNCVNPLMDQFLNSRVRPN